MAKKKKVDNLEKYTKDLEREFQQWDAYYNYGGQDPFHEDGVNLYLIRNHIIYYKRKIEEEINNNEGQLSFNEKKYPDIYFKETPPEVSYTYMAVPNKILDTAISFVRKLENEPAYKFIMEHVDEVFPNRAETEVTKKLNISFIPTMHLTRYNELIESGKLVDIRRTFFNTDYDKFVTKLEETAKKFEQFLALTPEEIEEMSSKKKRSNHKGYEMEEYEENDKPSISKIINDAEKRASIKTNTQDDLSMEYEIT